MIDILRTTSENADFQDLVKQLDYELSAIDGDEHPFYDQFNKTHNIKHVVIAYKNKTPVSCGAIKEFDANSMEIKRMFTISTYRGKGIATRVLQELEKWAMEMDFKKCILETGIRQPDAIRLYNKNGYKSITNYGQYENIKNSRCFEKPL